jgi:hypothetical protein
MIYICVSERLLFPTKYSFASTGNDRDFLILKANEVEIFNTVKSYPGMAIV